MTFPSDESKIDLTTPFPSRSLAAKWAKKLGFISFECVKFGQGDGHYWKIEPRKETSVLAYGLQWSIGRDYVSHVEIPKVPTHAIIVVTCHPDEVDTDELDELLKVEPLTPSMLLADGARRAKRTAREHVEARQPVATLTFMPGYDVPTLHPITGMPLDEIL